MTNSKLPIIGAIIIAGAMISGAIIYTQRTPSDSQVAAPISPEDTGDTADSIWDIIKPIDQDDYILGSPDAELTLVLYSDIECPYCKNFHATMHQIMDEYGKTGKLKWIYRHFPLEMMHPTAAKEAEATECAGELGGNAKFWEYIDELTNGPSLSQENLTNELTNIAEKVGVNKNEFKECLESGKYEQKIKDSIQEAANLGVQGTPFSIVIDSQGKTAAIPGALPYEQVKDLIDKMLQKDQP